MFPHPYKNENDTSRACVFWEKMKLVKSKGMIRKISAILHQQIQNMDNIAVARSE